MQPSPGAFSMRGGRRAEKPSLKTLAVAKAPVKPSRPMVWIELRAERL
jgi:hypothetical protein